MTDLEKAKLLIRKFPELAWSLSISGKTLEIYRFCQVQKTATSSQIAKKFNTTTSNASNFLKKLVDLKYLVVDHQPLPTGGFECIYTLHPELKD